MNPVCRKSIFDRVGWSGYVGSVFSEVCSQMQQGTDMSDFDLILELQQFASRARYVVSALAPSSLCTEGCLIQWICLPSLGMDCSTDDPPEAFSEI